MPVNLAVVLHTRLRRFLVGVAARYFQKLEWMLGHRLSYAACLSDVMSELSSAAFGLTTQNFGRYVR